MAWCSTTRLVRNALPAVFIGVVGKDSYAVRNLRCLGRNMVEYLQCTNVHA